MIKLDRDSAIAQLWELYESEHPSYQLIKQSIVSLDYYVYVHYDDYVYYDDDYDYHYDDYYDYDDYRHTIICLILAAEGEL